MFTMPKPYPKEFRRDVIAVARRSDAPLRQIAQDFGISETCLQRWMKVADREESADRPGGAAADTGEAAELREARKRIRVLEQEAEVMRRAVGYLSQHVNPK
ncbi:transposase [Rhodococcus rhodnii LMG 5362]|uniref:Transposase n=1 Tax=Rhodococcus rhodnii LMG 5362 TaxID=1273125 RepID=R7WQG9_9NOCA|nr:transposase [Rhodococcus rhodnii LMG 5362]